MNYGTAALVMTTSVLVIFTLLWFAWSSRRKRDAVRYEAPLAPNEAVGEPVAMFDGVHYVATSLTGKALERITVEPLGYRGRCSVEVRDKGLIIAIHGERPFQILADQLIAVEAGTATIDRAVERGGLIVLRWWLGTSERRTSVETSLRVVDPVARKELTNLLSPLASAHDSEGANPSEESSL